MVLIALGVNLSSPALSAVYTLVAGSNIVITNAYSNPTVAVTASPTFTNATISSLSSGQCVQAGVGGQLTTTGAACITSVPPTPAYGTVTLANGSSQATLSSSFASVTSCVYGLQSGVLAGYPTGYTFNASTSVITFKFSAAATSAGGVAFICYGN
jgi:hypothetical protein